MAHSRFRRILAGTAAAGTVIGLGVGTAALSAGAAPAAAATDHVIVVLKNQHPDAPAAAATIGRRAQLVASDQAGLVAQARGSGARDVRQLHVANAFAATVSPAEASRLATDPAVAEVVADRLIAAPRRETASPTTPSSATPGPVSSTICPSDPAHPLLEPEALQVTHTAFANPATPSAQHIATGRGVTVAFIADGLDINNPDFIRADGSHVFTDYRDFSGDGPAAPTPAGEAFGDASAIAAQGRQTYDISGFVNPAHPLPPGCTIQVRGMAPGASLVGLKVFPAGGFAFNSAVLQALDWAVTVDHADVINESFGSNQFPDTNDDPAAVFNEQLIHAGVTIVASSGDSGPFNTIGSPASAPDVIAAGGTTTFRAYAQTTYSGFQLSNGRYRSNGISGLSSSGFTQPGRTVDLVAPGDLGWALCTANVALYADCRDDKGAPTNLQVFGGTSQSSPLIAGAAALVIQSYRDTHHGASPTPNLVRRLLTSTADDLGLPAQEQGAGLLDSLRAVRAARSAGTDPAGNAPSLLVNPHQIDITSEGGVAVAHETVTNLSDRPQILDARVRSTSHVIGQQAQSVPLDASTAPTFVDSFGRARAFTSTTFTVPSGASRVTGAIAWPSPTAIVRLILLAPDGTYTAYSIPQGSGSFGFTDVPSPVPGRWTAVLFTAKGPAGFTGTVALTTTSYRNGTGGEAEPGHFELAPGQSRTITIRAEQSRRAGDAADALVLSAHRDGDRDAATASSVVPIVLRTLVDLDRSGRAHFAGTLAGGNGRAGIPNPGQTYAFDVRPGARDLSVGLTITGNPNEVLYGFLTAPSGEPLSERTNQRIDAHGNVTLVNGLQLTHLRPQPGRWHFVFAVFNPIAGTATETPFAGQVALNTVRAAAHGLPDSPTDVLPAGQPVTATLSFANTGATDQAYFADGRLDTRANLGLVVANSAYPIVGAPLNPFPAAQVPTQSDALTVAATADHGILFEVSPFPADHVGDLSFEGDPDREAGPAGTAPSVTVTDPEIASQTWLALPSTLGPFGPAGGPTVHTTFTATAHSRQFDPAVTSTTGDPMLRYVDASAPAATPLVVSAGGSGSIRVTITPSGTPGTVVHGVLYLDTLDAVTGSTDEVAAVPYSYRIG